MHLDLTVDYDEWEVAASLVRFTSLDERETIGMVCLSCRDGIRRWSATNTRWLASWTTPGEPGSFQVLVSPRIITVAVNALSEGETAQLLVTQTDDGVPDTVTVRAGLASLTVSADRGEFPDADGGIEAASLEPGATIEIDATDLAEVMAAAATQAYPLGEDDESPLFWVILDDGELHVDLAWPGLGRTIYRITGSGTGRSKRAFPPKQVSDALLGWSGEVTFHIPDDPHAPLRIADAERTVLIMPIDTTHEVDRKHAEDVLSRVFGPDVLHRDDDGDYPLTVNGVPVYARLVNDRPPALQVFACLLVGVDSSPELAEELNAHNASMRFVRLFWVDGQVLAESDLVASTLDPEELITAFERVRSVSEDLAPMLGAVIGGTTLSIDEEARWAAYRSTVVTVETGPGSQIDLTGPAAIDPWPYPDTVYVLTAWNPGGRRRPVEVNGNANLELARDLLGQGAGILNAMGSDPGSDYAEPGFMAWDIDRETAVALGRRVGQDAVFEIDANEVRVVSCVDDRVDVIPRLTQT